MSPPGVLACCQKGCLLLATLMVIVLLFLPGEAGVTNWVQPQSNSSGNYAVSLAEFSSREITLAKSMALSGKFAGAPMASPTVNRTHVKCRKLLPGMASFGVLEVGDTGSLVQRAQSRLRISSDGIFGPKTRASVVNIQQENLLLVDGQIGRQTGCALGLSAGKKHKSSVAVTISNLRTGYGGTVLVVARRFLGIPYVWGGDSRSGMDCSGFTMTVYAIALGIHLPHFSGAQPQFGHRVTIPSPGDLVSWPGHVGIYYGKGKVIGARHSGTVSQIYRIYGNPSFYRMG